MAIHVHNLALREYNLALPPIILAQLINNLALGIHQQENRPPTSIHFENSYSTKTVGVAVIFLLAKHVHNLAIKVDNLALRDYNLALPPIILAQLIDNLALGIYRQENRPPTPIQLKNSYSSKL